MPTRPSQSGALRICRHGSPGERVSEQNGAPNETARIEAFSDGVFAIAITLLILEIQVPPQTPHGGLRRALLNLGRRISPFWRAS